MTTTIHPSLANVLAERATAAPDPRPPAAGDAWRAAFEQAGGEQFGGWFQAPTEQPDAGRSPGAAALPGGRVATGNASTASWRPALATSGGHAVEAAGARPAAKASAAPAPAAHAAAPASAADHVAAHAVVQATASAPLATTPSDPAASTTVGMPGVLAPATSAPATLQLAAALQSWLGVDVMPVADEAAIASPEAAAPSSGAATPRAADEPEDDAATVADTDAPNPPERGAGAKTEQSPLRLHAEWTDDGVRVWLGADAQGLPDVAALATQLQRWLAGQGLSLLGLVCNGRDLLRGESAPSHLSDEPRAPQRARATDLSLPFTNLYPSPTR